MKNSFIKLSISLSSLLLLWSCDKEENKIFYEGGTPPVLTASKSGTIPLSFDNKDQEAVKLMWTNPDYKFTTGVSSQSVTYQVELDTTGANFTNPQKKVLTIKNNLSVSITQNDLNDYLLNQLQLKAAMSHNIETWVTSTLGSAASLTSNVLIFTVTPYSIPPKVAPPASKTLPRFFSVSLACASISPFKTVFVSGSSGPCPDTNSKLPQRIA